MAAAERQLILFSQKIRAYNVCADFFCTVVITAHAPRAPSPQLRAPTAPKKNEKKFKKMKPFPLSLRYTLRFQNFGEFGILQSVYKPRKYFKNNRKKTKPFPLSLRKKAKPQKKPQP